MSAKRFSWFSMLTILPHSSRPFVSFLSFCAKPSFKPSAPPRLRVSSFLPHSLPLPFRPWRTLRETFFRPPSALLPPRRGKMPHPRKWSPWLARDYRKHWSFRLFSAFRKPRGRDACALTAHPLPSLVPCPRSGFHGFQCWSSSRTPAAPFVSFLSFCTKASSKRSASPRLRVSSFLPLSSCSLGGLCGLCVRYSSAPHPLSIRFRRGRMPHLRKWSGSF